AARLGGDAGAPPPGLAHLARNRAVVRPGDPVSARGRAPPGVLPYRRPRRPASDAREGNETASDARPGARAEPPCVPRPPGRPRGRPPLAGSRSSPAAPAHPRGDPAARAPGSSGPAPAPRARGPPVARFRDPGVSGWPRGEPPDGPALPPGRLSPRVSAWLGQQDRLRSASPRPVAAGERPGIPPDPPRRRSRAQAAHRAPRRADGGEPLLPGGDRP